MPTIKNPLYIGENCFSIEGRTLKHPATFSRYSTPTLNKISREPIPLISIDIESNYKTGETKLLGIFDGFRYYFYTDHFDLAIRSLLEFAAFGGSDPAHPVPPSRIAWWSRFDPFQLFRVLLLESPAETWRLQMLKYQNISGAWNNKKRAWTAAPITSISRCGDNFGIMNAIRSAVLFYYRRGDGPLKQIWGYDVRAFYNEDLKTEAAKRIGWYSKLYERDHLLDDKGWRRFNDDPEFRAEVLKSNELDCRAAHYLGMEAQNDFAGVFDGWYMKSLISAGSSARAGVLATIFKHNEFIVDQSEKYKKCLAQYRGINLITHAAEFRRQLSPELYKNLLCIIAEAFSGARIECYAYGSAPVVFTADIMAAYNASAQHLNDLEGATICHGFGVPPRYPNAYTIIRGLAHIPDDLEYHPLTVKHILNENTNITAIGDFKASYLLRDRDFCIEYGATFDNEEWFTIITRGNLSALALASIDFANARFTYEIIGDLKYMTAKRSANSIYGITQEGTPTYALIESKEELIATGFRGGDLYNGIYSEDITSATRCKISRACMEIKKRGGHPITAQTDAVTWAGNITDLPPDLWRADRNITTLGYFEEPTEIHNYISLGAGRYEYIKKDKKTGKYEKYIGKQRGLNVSDYVNKDGIMVNDFNWKKILNNINEISARFILGAAPVEYYGKSRAGVWFKVFKKRSENWHNYLLMIENNKISANIKVRILISPAMALRNHKYTAHDIGLIVDEWREVEIITGDIKRVIVLPLPDYKKLSTELIWTKPLKLGYGMMGDNDYPDMTLPKLRDAVMEKNYESSLDKKHKKDAGNSQIYRTKNYNELKQDRAAKYEFMMKNGASVKKARKARFWAWTTVYKFIKNI